MGTKAIIAGPVSERIGGLIRARREELGITADRLGERLASLGRPMSSPAIFKIEAGVRRVDVDDLVVFAIALEVTPNWLLLGDYIPIPEPPDDNDRSGYAEADDDTVEMTPGYAVESWLAWEWAGGETPLPTGQDGPITPAHRIEFQTRNRPHRSPLTMQEVREQAVLLVSQLADNVSRALSEDKAHHRNPTKGT